MPLTIPTLTLEKLKKFPSQAFISILLVLVGYFINVTINSKDINANDWKQRALTSERKNDSLTRAFSNLRDALIQKQEKLNFYQEGATKVDSIVTKVIRPKAKRAIKR